MYNHECMGKSLEVLILILILHINFYFFFYFTLHQGLMPPLKRPPLDMLVPLTLPKRPSLNKIKPYLHPSQRDHPLLGPWVLSAGFRV